MRQIRLTESCDTFSYTWDEQKHKLELRWDTSLDLSCASKVRLCSIQMDGFWSDEYVLVPVCCNFIDSTTFNPLREVQRILIDPLQTVIDDVSTGKQTMIGSNKLL